MNIENARLSSRPELRRMPVEFRVSPDGKTLSGMAALYNEDDVQQARCDLTRTNAAYRSKLTYQIRNSGAILVHRSRAETCGKCRLLFRSTAMQTRNSQQEKTAHGVVE